MINDYNHLCYMLELGIKRNFRKRHRERWRRAAVRALIRSLRQERRQAHADPWFASDTS